jgi:hypothetical protein
MEEFFKEQELISGLPKFVFEQIKNILTTGAVFYILNRYSEYAAKASAFILVSCMLYPVILPFIALITYNKVLRIVIQLSISLVCSYYFTDKVAQIVSFIGGKP